ncbi:MAG: hypothetical protein JRH01_00780 [Deltaproteobacteria bacterium]|nr:hypothetical protein [Deltaproteobacteria bacterium]MBW2393025.1 hypothetical protein [Deltaproteobacteria bacterium]
MTPEASQTLAQDLCRIFLGWKLRDDYEALLAIGEGSLRLDLRTGEAWCDGDPLPSLFIGQELRREIEKATSTSGALEGAELDAEFQTRRLWHRGEQVPSLEIACRVRLRIAGREVSAEASTQT